ncbi:MAG: hypothetical protein WKG00_04250, partial [Polyangiaceae bacterium]
MAARDVHAVGDAAGTSAASTSARCSGRRRPESRPTEPTALVGEAGVVGEAGFMVVRRRLGISARVDPNQDTDDEGDNFVFTGGVSFRPLGNENIKVGAEYTHREELFGLALDNDALTLGLQLAQDERSPRARRLWLALSTAALGLCRLALRRLSRDASMLRAKVIESRSEVAGGRCPWPTSATCSRTTRCGWPSSPCATRPCPGVYGGSVVDIDRRRAQIGSEGGLGRDARGELPVANLLVPDPRTMDARVIADGSDGQEAIVRGRRRVPRGAEHPAHPAGVAEHLLSEHPHPAALRHRLRAPSGGAARTTSCPTRCRRAALPSPAAIRPDHGQRRPRWLPGGECSVVLLLEIYGALHSVFGGILGDSPRTTWLPPDPKRAGIIAGDFVFFGNQNDVCARPGFDEDYAAGRLQHRQHLQRAADLRLRAAAGGDVSYGYFTKATEDGPPWPPTCRSSPAPPPPSWPRERTAASPRTTTPSATPSAPSPERYLVVGDGDIASVTAEMRRVRGTPTGHVSGHVLWSETGEPVKNARLFVFLDPDPGAEIASVGALAEKNLRARGDVGVVDAMDADLGLDPTEDGDFAADLLPGDYRVVAQNPG